MRFPAKELEGAARRRGFDCATCHKPVAELQFRTDPYEDALQVTGKCHGAKDTQSFDALALVTYDGRIRHEAFVLFRKSWAKYSLAKPVREGVLS